MGFVSIYIGNAFQGKEYFLQLLLGLILCQGYQSWYYQKFRQQILKEMAGIYVHHVHACLKQYLYIMI